MSNAWTTHFSSIQSRCKCKGADNVFDYVMQRCFVVVGDVCMADAACLEHAECQNDGTCWESASAWRTLFAV